MDPSQTIHERNIEQTVDIPFPQGTEQTVHEYNMEQTVEEPVPRDIEVTVHMAPATAATKKRRRAKGTPTPADAHAASDPVIDSVAPVTEYVSTSPATACAAPVPVIKYVAQ